ncbi:response regulator transcription factor [Paractinoplanes abujensis]|uniref:DNA-binding NarL/FixJ family response regulator n=1 Tax=Paractinoplanes abujensis TaxID=882441 RepID=A0A7W7CMV3_9ACTN|nr:response regulator transcription factor [Actinoplanes abujensis]MBB4691484.1 DNA-binding NarL/FixJ family response regulator [Actinoplanes abujensis]
MAPRVGHGNLDGLVVIRALQAGAAGCLVKSTPPAELLDLIRVAAQGHTVLSPVAKDGLVAVSGPCTRSGRRPGPGCPG